MFNRIFLLVLDGVGIGEAPVARPSTQSGFDLTASVKILAASTPISSAVLKILISIDNHPLQNITFKLYHKKIILKGDFCIFLKVYWKNFIKCYN